MHIPVVSANGVHQRNGIYRNVRVHQSGEHATDDEYRLLQNALWRDPMMGDVVRGGGGIRKMRFAVEGRGKSGGVRVIY